MKIEQLYKLLWAMLVSSLLCSPVVFASFDKAMELYHAKDFDRAYQAFYSMAEIGDLSSMFNLGVMHYRGESVPRDPVQAYAWFNSAGSLAQHQDYLDMAEKVLKTLSATDREKSQLLAAEFTREYNREAIDRRIFPKPLSDEDCEPDPVAIKKKPPRYPMIALDKGQMGRVVIEFTISQEGYVRDLVTVSYDRSFKSAAVRAVKMFLYEPPMKEGKPYYHYGHNVAVVFKIAGKKEVNSRRLKLEIEKVRRKAEAGDPVSQYVYATRLNVFRSFKEYLEKLDLQYQESNRWYLASAQKGLLHAQFALGRNMIRGRGCEVDEQGGMKWINAAAVGGYSPAQHYLAQNLLKSQEEAVNRSALAWLQNAAVSEHYPSKLLLAWELSTSGSDAIRNGAEALNLLDGKPKDYHDSVRILETKAAALAEAGQFKQAVTEQKRALKEAKALQWDIPVIVERLERYQQKETWRGKYYDFPYQSL